jgi:hypothetical protein
VACAIVTATHRLEVMMTFSKISHRGVHALAAAVFLLAALAQAATPTQADPADPHAPVPESQAATGLADYQRYQPAAPGMRAQDGAAATVQDSAPAMAHHDHHSMGQMPPTGHSGHTEPMGPMDHSGHMADMPGMQH